MEIRPVVPGDYPDLSALCSEHAAYEDTKIDDVHVQDQWDTAFFSLPPKLYCWVCNDQAKIADKLCGYMTASIGVSTWSRKPHVFLDCIYLRSEVRGCGGGKALVAVLIKFARDNCCEEIQWQSHLSNKLAARFYRSVGATPATRMRWALPVS
ncbi:GNAT family N-acetyltransferase [Sinorhizobium meliloti]|uniref:GNAT family N-acetyltransferase n=1 Tax=Rhizobium meliloti TaxID=382 RepID=UPI0009B7C8AE|nr:GNAT family N-acetyltransferase [Sinorhizobium meliloti]